MSTVIKASQRHKAKRKPGDPWISKNRVLNGGGSGRAKRNCPIYRNPNFDTDETKLLIQLWGDPKTQRELITTHKKHVVITQLAAKMEEYGYYRSPEEITTRIKNMKCFYNRLKKEMETTNNVDPSWRHFVEMDTIMTRPIFSVRPNEVPAPSLKYLLEQKQEKREERKRKAEEEGCTISDSDEDITDILALPNAGANTKPQESANKDIVGAEAGTELESDENNDTPRTSENSIEKRRKLSNEEVQLNRNEQTISEVEMAIKLEIESEQFQEYQSMEETEATNEDTKSKRADDAMNIISISSDENLLVPKVEPIDLDEEFMNSENAAPKARPPSQTSGKQNFTQLVDILNQPAKAQNMPPSAMIKFSMPTNSTAVTISTANSSIPTQSKISVVSPTILMPTQIPAAKSTLATTTDQRQVRLQSNLHALLAASGSRTTVTNGNGMKFLLVNAADQRGPPITTANLTSAIPMTGTNRPNQSNLKIIQNTTQLQQQQQQHQQQQKQQQKQQLQQQLQQQHQQPQKPQNSNLEPASFLKLKEVTKNRQEYREQLKKRDLLGIKTALVRLLKAQEESNEVQNERLSIERERLKYEKSIADKFLSIVDQNQKIQQQMQQQIQQQQHQLLQHQHQIQLQQRPITSPQIFATNASQANVAQNSQIMLPPKLLITTMVPNSAGQAAAVANSKVLTTTGFTNLAANGSNDLQQLVVPKEEPTN